MALALICLFVAAGNVDAAAAKKARPPSKKAPVATRVSAPKASVAGKKTKTVRRARRRRRWHPTWTTPEIVQTNGAYDLTEGEDLTVRRAALEALGNKNGTVVVADPQTGRILTIVNQDMALGRGFQPCSTFKVVVGLGALAEGLITRSTPIRVSRRESLNLTQALASSNNPYFQELGRQLGFEKVHAYAELFGLGERATLNVDREQPGRLTATTPGLGVGFMSSHGEGIQLTAVQLAAVMTVFANGGTLYHLQYPRTHFEAEAFEPKIKRQLAIADWIPDVKPGMMGAVEFGTARRANANADEPILGKTGTCTDRDSPTHLGWFGSFNDVNATSADPAARRLVVVVLLTGGSHVSGSEASGVGGAVYRNLIQSQYLASRHRPVTASETAAEVVAEFPYKDLFSLGGE